MRAVLDVDQQVGALPAVGAAVLGAAAGLEALARGAAERVALPVRAQAPAQLPVQLQAFGVVIKINMGL